MVSRNGKDAILCTKIAEGSDVIDPVFDSAIDQIPRDKNQVGIQCIGLVDHSPVALTGQKTAGVQIA